MTPVKEHVYTHTQVDKVRRPLRHLLPRRGHRPSRRHRHRLLGGPRHHLLPLRHRHRRLHATGAEVCGLPKGPCVSFTDCLIPCQGLLPYANSAPGRWLL